MSSFEEIEDKKIKIWSKAYTGRVIVAQDGDAADADIVDANDLQIDDAFVSGYDYGSPALFEDGLYRMTFDLVSMQTSRDGRTFVFEVQDFTTWNVLSLSPGDRVEFSANVGEKIGGDTNWPSWHAQELAAGTRQVLFYGFVDEVRRQDRDSGESVFLVTCIDPIRYSNRVKVMQSVAEGVTIPTAIFNVDDPADPDRILAIKRYDDEDPVVTQRFRQGNALDPGSELMALGEILEYLEGAYQAELFARGIISGASDPVFDSGDLSGLTIVPPKTVLENQGFGDAVRSLIRSNLPDHEVTVDPRSRRWRIRALSQDLLTSGMATIVSADPDLLTFEVDDASIFSNSGNGSTVRIQSSSDINKSVVREIATVTTGGGTEEIVLEAVSGFQFEAGDLVFPMYAASDRPPGVGIDLLGDAPTTDLTVDLNGVYAAVSIVGRNQKRERKTITRTASPYADPSVVRAQLRAAWDTDAETETRYHEHRHRRIDRGPGPNYPGIYIDEIATIGSGDEATTRIWFSEEDSAFENDHWIPNGDPTRAEWVGAACHFLTQDGDDIEAATISAIVTHFNRDGYMDSPTNTIRRFRFDLDRDVLALGVLPGLKDRVNNSAPDLFQLSSSEIHKPSNPNRRWAVGRVWQVESTTVDDDARLLDSAGCSGYTEYPSRYTAAVTLRQSAYPVEQSSEAPRTFQEVVDFHNLNPADPLNGGVPRAWFIEPPEPPPTFEDICASIPEPPPPQEISIELDKLTQEVRSVRVPAAGYRGLANLWHNHTDELYLLTDAFEHESQEAQFEAIAGAIWRRVSAPHYTGSLPLVGCAEWLRLVDGGFRVSFGSGDTGYANGAVTEQGRFWGLVQDIRYDFRGGSTSIAFESTGFADTLKQDLFERQFVSETAEMKELKHKVALLEKAQRCAQTRPPASPPRIRTGCEVAIGPVSVSARVSVTDPKNLAGGGARVSIGIKGATTDNPLSTYGSLSFNPAYVVERNLADGSLFAIDTATGALVGGAASGSSYFIPDQDTAPHHYGTQRILSDDNQEVFGTIFGIDLNTPAMGQNIATDAGSTTTVIQLRYAIPNDGRFDDGFIEFHPDGSGVARPAYEILSHTSRTVTLKSAMAEDPIGSGVGGTIYPSPAPTTDPTDFPDGGVPFQDSDDNWFVSEGGAAMPATLNGSVLESGSGSPSLDIGFAGGEHVAVGEWDFRSADDVKGVVDVEATAAGQFAISDGADSWTVLQNGASNSGKVLMSSGTGAKWVALSGEGIRESGGGGGTIELYPALGTSVIAPITVAVSGLSVPAATTSIAGAMVASDKTKLDSVSSSADVTSEALLSVLTGEGSMLYRGPGGLRGLAVGSEGDWLRVSGGTPIWSSGDQSFDDNAIEDVSAIGNGTPGAGYLADFDSAVVSEGGRFGQAWLGNAPIGGVVTFGYAGIAKGSLTHHALAVTAGGTCGLNAPSGESVNVTIAGGGVLGGVDCASFTSSGASIAVPFSLASGTSANEISTDSTFADDSDDAIPTEKATRAFVGSLICPMSYTGFRVGPFSAGTTYPVFVSGSDDPYNMRIPVPAGETFKVLGILMRGRAGGTTGDFDYRAGVGTFSSHTSGTIAKTELASGVFTENEYVKLFAKGTPDSPLATITGGATVDFAPYFEIDSAPGASASTRHQVIVWGIWV